MVNAAVEFDLDRMRPVYKLHIGLPGRSFAIDVACRLGIPPTIVQRARELVGDSGAGIAALLNRLHALERARGEEVARAEADRAAAGEARKEAEGLVASLRQQLVGLQRQTRQVVAEIAADARRRVEALLAEAQRTRAGAEARRAIRGLHQAAEARLAPLAAEVPDAAGAETLEGVAAGQAVWVRSLGQRGTVLAPPVGDGLVEVQLPLGKARVALLDLGPAASPAPRASGGVSWTAGAGDALTTEINVIGCTVEEAEARVNRYLEDALLGGLARVRIIHGKGTGRLRRGIAALLKTHPLVTGFQLATFDEGGSGATIVEVGPRNESAAADDGGGTP
jgi:DNA mismatch repair protein MutS2